MKPRETMSRNSGGFFSEGTPLRDSCDICFPDARLDRPWPRLPRRETQLPITPSPQWISLSGGGTGPTLFDSTGGPWNYELRYVTLKPSNIGAIELYIAAGTFSNQPQPECQGIIPVRVVYAGLSQSGDVYITRQTFTNQGAQFRAVMANYKTYPKITVVNSHNLYYLQPVLPSLVIEKSGEVSIPSLLNIASLPAVTGNQDMTGAIRRLLSSCAASSPQRTQVASALKLPAGRKKVLESHGVLLDEKNGTFTSDDTKELVEVLDALPQCIVDRIHRVVLDEKLGCYGGYQSGEEILLKIHAKGSGGPIMYPYPDGSTSQMKPLQHFFAHEIGHLVDLPSPDRARFDTLYTAGAGKKSTFLCKVPLCRQEDFVRMWCAYLQDSEKALQQVAKQADSILSGKFAYVLDHLPHQQKDKIPFYKSDADASIHKIKDATITRGQPLFLGDDGPILSVDGVKF